MIDADTYGIDADTRGIDADSCGNECLWGLQHGSNFDFRLM
jgi:hypothetical protein